MQQCNRINDFYCYHLDKLIGQTSDNSKENVYCIRHATTTHQHVLDTPSKKINLIFHMCSYMKMSAYKLTKLITKKFSFLIGLVESK